MKKNQQSTKKLKLIVKVHGHLFEAAGYEGAVAEQFKEFLIAVLACETAKPSSDGSWRDGKA